MVEYVVYIVTKVFQAKYCLWRNSTSALTKHRLCVPCVLDCKVYALKVWHDYHFTIWPQLSTIVSIGTTYDEYLSAKYSVFQGDFCDGMNVYCCRSCILGTAMRATRVSAWVLIQTTGTRTLTISCGRCLPPFSSLLSTIGRTSITRLVFGIYNISSFSVPLRQSFCVNLNWT